MQCIQFTSILVASKPSPYISLTVTRVGSGSLDDEQHLVAMVPSVDMFCTRDYQTAAVCSLTIDTNQIYEIIFSRSNVIPSEIDAPVIMQSDSIPTFILNFPIN